MKYLKYLLLTECVFFIAFILALFWVDSDVYNEYLSSKISALVNQNNIPLTITKPKYFLTGVEAKEVNCSLPIGKSYIILQPKDLILKTSLFAILRKQLSTKLESKLYDGDFSGEINQLTEDTFNANVKVSGLDIKQHPQLAPFGMSSGKLNLELENFHFTKERILEGELKLSISDFELPKELELESYGLPITIPEIKDLTLDGELSLKTLEDGQPNLVIKSLNLKSSLLEFNIDGDLKFFNDALNNLRISGNVTLSDKLRKLANPQLILAAVQASGHRVVSNLTKESSSFSINIAGLVKKLRIECEDKKSPTIAEDSITARKIKRAKLKR